VHLEVYNRYIQEWAKSVGWPEDWGELVISSSGYPYRIVDNNGLAVREWHPNNNEQANVA
jgi:hypothetical protein